MVFADVTREPLVLHLPDTNDRYYVMQSIDAWTNNFAYLGRRATGTKEGLYLLAGPDWEGDVPDGVTLVRAPTNIFVVIGRFACEGDADIPNVQALQAATWVTPHSLYPDRPDTSGRHFGDWELAPYDERVRDELRFWEQYRAWMHLFPPPDVEQAYIQKFEPLGVLAGATAGWGGLPQSAAFYILDSVDKNDGQTPHAVTDVPVDAFWSVTVYNADGYLEANDLRVNSYNNFSAQPSEDGSYTIRFGGDPLPADHQGLELRDPHVPAARRDSRRIVVLPGAATGRLRQRTQVRRGCTKESQTFGVALTSITGV